MEFAHPFAYGANYLEHHSPSFSSTDLTAAVTTSAKPTKPDEAEHVPMEHHAQLRKDSMTGSAGVLTPSSTHIKWESRHDLPGLGMDPSTQFAPTNPFHVAHHGYGRNEPVSVSTTNQSLGGVSWPFEYSDREPSPANPDLHSPPGDFDASRYHNSSLDHSHPPLSSFRRVQSDVGQDHTPAATIDRVDLMQLAAQENEDRKQPKRVRPSSSVRSPSDAFKPDGVRKKNTRIEIPPERSLLTIEHLLEHVHDEDEVKELKSQRRLLRNREAALASRQRKKKHTEDLEVKEKDHLGRITTLDAQLNDMHVQLTSIDQERQYVLQRHAEACNMVEALQMEKEEMILKHTNETGNLRRRIQFLTEQLENPPPPMSAQPSSAGFNDFTSDMDNLTVGGSDWDNFIFNEPQIQEARYSAGSKHVNQTTGTVHNDTDSKSMEAVQARTSSDQPIASGILFMLLLCGAFVASRPTSRPVIPRMPDEVRAASNTVLDNLLKDSKSQALSFGTHARQSLTAATEAEPNPSHPSFTWLPHQVHQQHNSGGMHRSLTQISKAQEADQLFSLTPAEYNSLTNVPHSVGTQRHDNNAIPPRRNLAESLADLRHESVSQGGPAEVYTRSLLWDQIPADVVKQFKELVRDSKRASEASIPTQEVNMPQQRAEYPHRQSQGFHVDVGR